MRTFPEAALDGKRNERGLERGGRGGGHWAKKFEIFPRRNGQGLACVGLPTGAGAT